MGSLERRTQSEEFQELYAGTFPDVLGVEITESAPGKVEGTLEVGRQHLAPNGFMHAGAVVGFVDTLCGLGTADNLPENSAGFTTIELKANFLGTARDGSIKGSARMVHGGRTTQVWDAIVTSALGKTIAVFRCTQLILYPNP